MSTTGPGTYSCVLYPGPDPSRHSNPRSDVLQDACERMGDALRCLSKHRREGKETLSVGSVREGGTVSTAGIRVDKEQ